MTNLFYLFAHCNFVPDRCDDVRARTVCHLILADQKQWQLAYDKLAKYVFVEEKTTVSYYFGIPMEYTEDYSASTMMLAFQVYEKREVTPHCRCIKSQTGLLCQRILGTHFKSRAWKTMCMCEDIRKV